MEIKVEEALTGAEYKEQLLAKYGSRDAIEREARRPRAFEAKDDLIELRLLDDPIRERLPYKVSTATTIRPGDLERLTPKRLRAYSQLARKREGMTITELAGRLHRDKKNVSRDVALLGKLGLVRSQVRGRRKVVRVKGRDIHIALEG
ncbi:MAG: HVO_A0114 family putative DNA-binding protein [Thermoplasmatota archaeon]